jgi:hypothetical protein
VELPVGGLIDAGLPAADGALDLAREQRPSTPDARLVRLLPEVDDVSDDEVNAMLIDGWQARGETGER